MLKILICLTLAFGPSMQAFAQGGVQPKKENVRFEDPYEASRHKDKMDELDATKESAEQSKMRIEALSLKAEQGKRYRSRLAQAKEQLKEELSEIEALSKDLEKPIPQISCFDMLALESGGKFRMNWFGTLVGFYGGAVLGAIITADLSSSGSTILGALAGGLVAELILFAPTIGDAKDRKSYKIASRFNIPEIVDTTLSEEQLKLLEKFKYRERALDRINKALKKRGKASAPASIDDVRAVMVEGFNSSDFCRANAPASNDIALMKPKQIHAYILSKLESRLGGSASGTKGTSDSDSSSAGGVRTAE